MLVWMGVAVARLAIGATTEASYEASIRAELRAGTGLGGVANNASFGTELAAIPSLTVFVTQGASHYSLQYDPQLLLPLYDTSSGVLVLHRVRGAVSWGGTATQTRLSLSEEFQYGTSDFFGLTRTSATVTPQLQPLPAVTSLLYIFSNSQAVLGLGLSRTWVLELTAGYLVSGGADQLALFYLPLQSGPYALMTMRKAVSVMDDLETAILLYGVSFSTGSTVGLGEATEGWTRRWTRYLKTELSAGVSAALESPYRGAPYSPEAFPVVRASVTELRQTTRGRSLKANLSLDVSPYIDRLTGNAYERSQALASADWSAPLGVGVLMQGGYARPLYGNLQGAAAVELLGAGLTYQPQLFLRFDAGIRGVWQQPLPGVAGTSSFQWVGLVGVLLKAGGAM